VVARALQHLCLERPLADLGTVPPGLYSDQVFGREVLKLRWKRIVLVVAVGLLIAASFCVGMVTGNRQALGWMLEVQEAEVTGALHQTVSALTLIRGGDQEEAIRLLETRVGTAVTTLPQDREWDQFSESQRQSLVLAKKYFAIYPPQAQAEESLEHLHEVLQRIPDEPLDPDSCSPAVRVLLLGVRGGADQPSSAEQAPPE
jgi:hypothetical protein